jgi:hypothetical protein
MGKSDELEDSGGRCGRLIHGIESNIANLRELRNVPGFLPEHGQNLEMAIKAQILLLGEIDNGKTMVSNAAPGFSINRVM